MKLYCYENGVDTNKIYIDYAGFDSYSTMYRAKHIFKVDTAILVSQKYHLNRCVYIGNKLGVKSLALSADVSDINSINSAVEKALAEFKHIDILINSAGIASFGKFLELEPAQFEKIIQVNLMGTYYTTRAIIPNMIERQTGDIINISSTAGLNGNALTSAYSASKFAVLGLTDSLMQEMRKHNIRVTALTPSTVATDMAKDLNLTDGNPDKVMQSEDMAELIISQLKLNRRVFVKNSSI